MGLSKSKPGTGKAPLNRLSWISPPNSDSMFHLSSIIALVSLLIASFFICKSLSDWYRRRELKRAYLKFRHRREELEARFFDFASSLGKPRGLRWIDCQWQDRVTFGRDRSSGMLTAFVGVNISFEAIEGEDMEEVAAVGTIREAAALFHYHYGNWGTGGRALFNMDPDSALERLKDQYESIGFHPRC